MTRLTAGILLLAAFVLLAGDSRVAAQSGATVAGQVVDGRSGLGLSDVRVALQGQPASSLTDTQGRFLLSNVPPGQHVLTVSVVGYVLVRREIEVGEGGSIFVTLPLTEGTGTYTERVEVIGELFRQAEPAVAAQQVIGGTDLQNLRGSVLDDPIRALQVLPGVAATDDLYSEFSVRGSDFGHIGLALDGVPSRFLSHTVQGVEEGGSIGMVNSDVLESVSLLNGSYPQRFGNRTGAQVEMSLREGSRDRPQARLAISGSSASLVGEGPIGRGRRASWLFSARKSYLDLLIKQVSDYDAFALGFSDVAAKVVVDVSPRHRVHLSALAGRAKLDVDEDRVGLNDPLVATNRAWLATLGWRFTHGPRLTVMQRLGVTGGAFGNRNLSRVVLDEGRSTDVSARSDLLFIATPGTTIEAGASAHWQHERGTRRRVVDPRRPAEVREDAVLDSRWTGAYALARWTGARSTTIAAGTRADHWDGTGQWTASPWVQAQTRAMAGLDLVAGSGIYQQYPGFEAVAGLRATPGLLAEHAWHTDVGLSQRIGTKSRAQVSVYQREERDGIRLPGDEWQLVNGRIRPPVTTTRYDNRLEGTARGVELLFQRRSPNGLSGWVSYSVGRFRQHDLVSGERFDGDFDQRHAVNVYGHYRINDRTSVALKIRASSNFPVRGYVQELAATPSNPVPDDQPARYALAETRNGTRLPAYARTDLRANRTFAIRQRSRLTVFVELMNVFDRTNWRAGNGTIGGTGEIYNLLDPLVPFVPSAGFLWEF